MKLLFRSFITRILSAVGLSASSVTTSGLSTSSVTTSSVTTSGFSAAGFSAAGVTAAGLVALLMLPDLAAAQTVRELPTSRMFRLGEGMVRIAEPGELSDTLSLWGDVTAPGRYIVPRGTTVPELISYARGPISLRTGETTLDWSQVRLEIAISRYDAETGSEEVFNFRYRYNEPVPVELRQFVLAGDDMVSLQVRRRPIFRDYVDVIAPAVTLLLSVILLYDRARGS